MAVTNTPDKSEMKADPERIWLQPRCCASEHEGRLWCEDKVFGDCEDGNEPTEYIRADLSRPPADQVPDMVERLGETLHDLSDSLRQIGFFSGERKHIARYEAVVSAFENLAALQAVPAASGGVEEIKTADQLKAVIEKWLFADDPSHWGRFEKALDAALKASTGEE